MRKQLPRLPACLFGEGYLLVFGRGGVIVGLTSWRPLTAQAANCNKSMTGISSSDSRNEKLFGNMCLCSFSFCEDLE